MEHESDSDSNCNWFALTVTKGLVKGLEDLIIRRQGETIQMTVLLRSARILRRIPDTYGDLLSVRLQ